MVQSRITGSNILLWRRGSSVVSAANLMITRDPRFRLLGEYSLQITKVRPQDAGDYCVSRRRLNRLFEVIFHRLTLHIFLFCLSPIKCF
jgi:hypothetical protein